MSENRLKDLHDAGQSIWLDFIDRTMLRNGDLARRIRDDALTGMTSNPTIFEKALAEGTDVRRSDSRSRRATSRRWSCSSSSRRPTCATRATSSGRARRDARRRRLRVDRGLARRGQRRDARRSPRRTRLWATVDRPNVMVKVPGTVEGAKAVRQLIAARHQRQHHAAVLDRGVRARDRRVHGRARGSRRGGQGHLERSTRWRASS